MCVTSPQFCTTVRKGPSLWLFRSCFRDPWFTNQPAVLGPLVDLRLQSLSVPTKTCSWKGPQEYLNRQPRLLPESGWETCCTLHLIFSRYER